MLEELESEEIIEKARILLSHIETNQMVADRLNDTRERFLAALLLLRENKITTGQLASLHIIDSAIRTLYTDPMIYLTHEFVENEEIQRQVTRFSCPNLKGLPTKVARYLYNATLVPTDEIPLNEMPERMHYPLVRRFFNFSQDEWDEFTKLMQDMPESEKFYYVLQAPHLGCWSSMIFNLQEVLQCMQILDWQKPTKSGTFYRASHGCAIIFHVSISYSCKS